MTQKPIVSVLASFDIDHFANPKREWLGGSFPNIEVYAFMHECLVHLFGEALAPKGASALQVMANAMRSHPETAEKVAFAIHEHFQNVRIPAISTFLPEITAPDNFEAWTCAKDALKFLVLTIHALREQFGHPCSTLELVGGSCVEGMWYGEDLVGDRVYVLNRITREAAVGRLLDRLSEVAQLAADKDVYLALEMEPGPLFVIGDWPSVVDLCSALDRSTDLSLKNRVGLNLDVAHWAFLAGVTPTMVRKHPSVLNRIIHAHVSDHSRGHCSDAIPTMFHSAADFLPWFELLVDLMNSTSTGRVMPYSGFVSCELESAYDLSSVDLARRITEHWLGACC